MLHRPRGSDSSIGLFSRVYIYILYTVHFELVTFQFCTDDRWNMRCFFVSLPEGVPSVYGSTCGYQHAINAWEVIYVDSRMSWYLRMIWLSG